MDFEELKEFVNVPGEIWDIPELDEENFDIEEYINGTTDY
jgi:hypothetical protein